MLNTAYSINASEPQSFGIQGRMGDPEEKMDREDPWIFNDHNNWRVDLPGGMAPAIEGVSE